VFCACSPAQRIFLCQNICNFLPQTRDVYLLQYKESFDFNMHIIPCKYFVVLYVCNASVLHVCPSLCWCYMFSTCL